MPPISASVAQHLESPGNSPSASANDHPLHIVEFVDGLGAGGAQTLMLLRAQNAERLGYRIDIVCLGDNDALAPQFLEHVAGVHRFPSRHVFEMKRIVRICALLRRLKPDVIHTHLRTSNIVGALCGKLSGIPVVTTLHNIFPEPGQTHARRDWAEKWGLRLSAEHAIAVGPEVARAHRSRLGRTPVTTIPNPVATPDDGIDPAERRARARAALELPFDAPSAHIILVVARLTLVKGAPDAIRILRRLVRARQDKPALKLMIAGTGPLASELAHQVESYGLGDSVFLLGRSEHVRELMAASDLLLLSSYTEGLPLVVLEALSMHLPVVATRVGDVPWLLDDGDYGDLFEAGDIDGAVVAIDRLLDLPDSARRMRAERAFRRVRDTFSVDGWLREVDRVMRRAGGALPSSSTVPNAVSSPTGAWSAADASVADHETDPSRTITAPILDGADTDSTTIEDATGDKS